MELSRILQLVKETNEDPNLYGAISMPDNKIQNSVQEVNVMAVPQEQNPRKATIGGLILAMVQEEARLTDEINKLKDIKDCIIFWDKTKYPIDSHTYSDISPIPKGVNERLTDAMVVQINRDIDWAVNKRLVLQGHLGKIDAVMEDPIHGLGHEYVRELEDMYLK